MIVLLWIRIAIYRLCFGKKTQVKFQLIEGGVITLSLPQKSPNTIGYPTEIVNHSQ